MGTQIDKGPEQGARKRARTKHTTGAGAGTRRGQSRKPRDEIDASSFLRDQSSPEAAVARRIAAGEGEPHDADDTLRAGTGLAVLRERVTSASKRLHERVSRHLRGFPMGAVATGLALFTVLGRRTRRT